MSKIGRKPISTEGIQVSVDENMVSYKGVSSSGVYRLPPELKAELRDRRLFVGVILIGGLSREVKQVWGLHRSLLAAAIQGAAKEFVLKLQVNGLGYKAVKSGQGLIFALGYSHKIPFAMPDKVSVSIDKTGQQLEFRSSNKELLGLVCSKVRALRPPEPYKGTGIKFDGEELIRKAGKTKAS